MADKGIRKKQPRIHAQTEGFYEEIRKEQQKNISSPGAALLGLIRDTVKRMDAVISELNDLRNEIGMSEILLGNAGFYDRALKTHDGKDHAAKPSPTRRTETAKKAVAARSAKENAGKSMARGDRPAISTRRAGVLHDAVVRLVGLT